RRGGAPMEAHRLLCNVEGSPTRFHGEGVTAMADRPPLTDVTTLRARARKNIEQGAVTQAYAANRDEVLRLLNEALATEIVCVLRYRRHHFMATGMHAPPVAAEFMEHAVQEMEHADAIAARVVELGGAPDFDP